VTRWSGGRESRNGQVRGRGDNIGRRSRKKTKTTGKVAERKNRRTIVQIEKALVKTSYGIKERGGEMVTRRETMDADR